MSAKRNVMAHHAPSVQETNWKMMCYKRRLYEHDIYILASASGTVFNSAYLT